MVNVVSLLCNTGCGTGCSHFFGTARVFVQARNSVGYRNPPFWLVGSCKIQDLPLNGREVDAFLALSCIFFAMFSASEFYHSFNFPVFSTLL